MPLGKNLDLSIRQLEKLFLKDRNLLLKTLSTLKIEGTKKKKEKLISPSDIRKLSKVLFNRKEITKKIHLFFNHKGGVGKTTLCTQLAYVLAYLDYRVLIIDIDSQKNATLQLGLTEDEAENQYKGIVDYFYGSPLEKLIVNITDNIDLIPAREDINALEQRLINAKNREMKIRKGFENSEIKMQYDFIFFDCHSSPTTLTTNALLIADQVNIITCPEDFSVTGINKALDGLIDACREYDDYAVDFQILVNRYNDSSDHRYWAVEIQKKFNGLIYENIITETSYFNNANTDKTSVLAIAKSTAKGVLDLIAFAYEFIEKSTSGRPEKLIQNKIIEQRYAKVRELSMMI